MISATAQVGKAVLGGVQSLILPESNDLYPLLYRLLERKSHVTGRLFFNAVGFKAGYLENHSTQKR
jgi:hypothetical protein